MRPCGFGIVPVVLAFEFQVGFVAQSVASLGTKGQDLANPLSDRSESLNLVCGKVGEEG